ncbi:hypothetical protein EYR41_010170 [Orbilia oligospora]|uniref:Uncharacterized protein n=1 Tax=Orbilia oligospora TaxID=2813651 RepID=A0A8H2DSB7_ORBOL|nr:hypothetical protein TWF128_005013 [Orbilia oligospora]TGJ64093.1 hypothetical protein EYR41_010170 [Orbilia oligospora]
MSSLDWLYGQKAPTMLRDISGKIYKDSCRKLRYDEAAETVKKSKKGMTGFINADKIEVNELPGTSSIDISKIPTEISKEQSAEEENEDEDEDRDEDENEDKDQG